MFDEANVQVRYNSRLRRMRILFTAGECFKARRPPADLKDRLDQRFKEDQEEGHIETYELYTKRLEELWQHVRDRKFQIDPNLTLRFTVGQGARRYSEIIVKRLSPGVQGLAYLSFNFQGRPVDHVSFHAFEFNITRQLRELKNPGKPDRAQLRFLYMLLRHGQTVENVALEEQPSMESETERTIVVRMNQQYRYVSLHLFDASWLKDKVSREKLWARAWVEAERLNVGKPKLSYLKKNTLDKLDSLANQGQRIGFNLPYDLLIAVDSGYQLGLQQFVQDDLAASEDAISQTEQFVYSLEGETKRPPCFTLDVDPHGMWAKISAVNVDHLDRVRAQIDAAWVEAEFKKCGLGFGFDRYLEPLRRAIANGKTLTGLVIAQGQAPAPGTVLKLHMIERKLDNQQTGGKIDIRDYQNLNMVQLGDLVAEVRYSDGVAGINVHGQEVFPLGSASEAGISAGDGIDLRDGSQFFAARTGMLAVEDNTVKVKEAYIHEGNVNLSSGNLRFDGAVVIKGDIESGAVVDINGQLVVNGTIGPSHVRCSGDLEVKGGIVTSGQGSVKVGGQIRCEFIENSEIAVKGDLIVQRSILNSRIIAGANVLIANEQAGVIAGGSLSCWGSIRTSRYGMSNGRLTHCRIGSDFANEQRLQRLKTRVDKMQKFIEAVQRGYKELENNKVSKTAQATKAVMLDKIKRGQKLLRKLINHFEIQEQRMNWNDTSTIYVSGVLDKSVNITAGGKAVPVKENLAGILVSAASFRGSHFVDLTEVPAFLDVQSEALIVPPAETGKGVK